MNFVGAARRRYSQSASRPYTNIKSMTSANSLIQRARDSGNPVIQNDRVTFFWEGDSAPRLISDLTDWEEHPKAFKRLSSTLNPASDQAVWSCSLAVPRDAYV